MSKPQIGKNWVSFTGTEQSRAKEKAKKERDAKFAAKEFERHLFQQAEKFAGNNPDDLIKPMQNPEDYMPEGVFDANGGGQFA